MKGTTMLPFREQVRVLHRLFLHVLRLLQQIQQAGQCTAVVSYTVTPTGNPTPTVTYTFTGVTTASGSGTGSGSTFNKGVTNVTVTATNACGTATCSFTVTVTDNQAPNAVCQNVTVQLDATGNYTLTQADIGAIGAGSTDNCTTPANLMLSVSLSSFDCDDVILGQPNDYALDLDGQNDYIQSAATNVLKVLPLSVEAWVKPALRTENTTFYPNNVLSNDLPGNHGHGFGANVNSQVNQITIEYEKRLPHHRQCGLIVQHLAAYRGGIYFGKCEDLCQWDADR
jgi:hypothetical protein